MAQTTHVSSTAITTLQPITLVVADDHPAIIDGVKAWLKRQQDMRLLGTATTGDKVLHLAQTLQPDVLVLGLSMPGSPTVDLVRHVHALPPPSARILIFSADSNMDEILDLLNAGVLGYALKTERWDGLMTAIRAVTRGEEWLSSTLASKLVRHTPQQNRAVLTPREQEVLRLMALDYDDRYIADTLTLTEGTVKLHIAHVYEKLGVHHRHQAVIWAWQQGLVERK